jgi:hypothetical protein
MFKEGIMLFKRPRSTDVEPPSNGAPEVIARAGSGVDELLRQTARIGDQIEFLAAAMEQMAGNQSKLDHGIRAIGKTVAPLPRLVDELGQTVLRGIGDLSGSLAPENNDHRDQAASQETLSAPGADERLSQISREISSIKITLEAMTVKSPTLNEPSRSISVDGPTTGLSFGGLFAAPSALTMDQLIQRIKAYKREVIEEATKGGRRLFRLSSEGKPHWYLIPTNPGDALIEVIDDAIATRRQAEGGPYFLAGAKRLTTRQLPAGIWMVLVDESDAAKLSPTEWQKISKLSRESGVMALSPTWADNVGRVLLDHLEILRIVVEGASIPAESS